jgi:hypothetical protein
MSYIPMIVQQSPPPSPRARELARQLNQVIQDFQRSYPDTKPADVQQAVQIAYGGPTSSAPARRLLAMSLAGGIAALGGVLFFMGESGEGLSGLPGDSMIWLVAGVIIVLGLVVAMRRS